MLLILISITAFLITLITHVYIFRKFRHINSDTVITLIIFLSGFIINCLFIFWLNKFDRNFQFPLTEISVYLLLSIIFIIFFLYTYLVEEAPTATILSVLGKKKRISEKEINFYFSNSKLINSRLKDLLKQNFIIFSKKRFLVLKKGRAIAKIINFYRSILGWKNFG